MNTLSGTFGDFASFVTHMKAIALVRMVLTESKMSALNIGLVGA